MIHVIETLVLALAATIAVWRLTLLVRYFRGEFGDDMAEDEG